MAYGMDGMQGGTGPGAALGPTGAMSPPSPNPGDMAQGLTLVGTAVQMLQQALQFFPVGDEMQKTVIDMIQKGSKMSPPSAQVPGVQATQLAGLGQQAEQTAMLQALSRAMGSQPAQPAQPGPGAPAGPM